MIWAKSDSLTTVSEYDDAVVWNLSTVLNWQLLKGHAVRLLHDG